MTTHLIRHQMFARLATASAGARPTIASTGRLCLKARCFSVFPDFDTGAMSTEGRPPNSQKRHRRKARGGLSAKPSFRFVDKLRVRAKAGDGGKGSLSMHQVGRKRHFRPDGGHGGDGGSVVIFADPKAHTLGMSSPHVRAAQGSNGTSQDRHGRKGKNSIVRVPCGVVVKRILNFDETWDPETKQVTKVGMEESGEFYGGSLYSDDFSDDEEEDDENEENEHEENEHGDDNDEIPKELIGFSDWDAVDRDFSDDFDDDDDNYYDQGNREKVVLADLDQPGSYVVVARGGRGGRGSCLFASRHGGLPDGKVINKVARPKEGEVAYLELELKLIADIGLVGFPNAGKSSLLRAMSRAGPRVAPYPFTTLHPFVGVVEYRDGFRLRAADIPGLIDGASDGRGKGIEFLRHVERTKALLYIVDAAGTDGRDPIEDLRILTKELSSYGDGDMLNRRALVVANKLDLLEKDEELEILSHLEMTAEELGLRVDGPALGISAGVSGVGLGPLSEAMRNIVLQSECDSDQNAALL